MPFPINISEHADGESPMPRGCYEATPPLACRGDPFDATPLDPVPKPLGVRCRHVPKEKTSAPAGHANFIRRVRAARRINRPPQKLSPFDDELRYPHAPLRRGEQPGVERRSAEAPYYGAPLGETDERTRPRSAIDLHRVDADGVRARPRSAMAGRGTGELHAMREAVEPAADAVFGHGAFDRSMSLNRFDDDVDAGARPRPHSAAASSVADPRYGERPGWGAYDAAQFGYTPPSLNHIPHDKPSSQMSTVRLIMCVSIDRWDELFAPKFHLHCGVVLTNPKMLRVNGKAVGHHIMIDRHPAPILTHPHHD